MGEEIRTKEIQEKERENEIVRQNLLLKGQHFLEGNANSSEQPPYALRKRDQSQKGSNCPEIEAKGKLL